MPIWSRIVDIFYWHSTIDAMLIGSSLPILYFATQIMAVIIVIGVIVAGASILAVVRSLSTSEKSVHILTILCFIYYLVAPKEPYSISMWPYPVLCVLFTPVRNFIGLWRVSN